MWEFHQKFNFVSTPWKIKIPLGIVWGTTYVLHKINPGNDFFYIKVSFIDNFKKNLTAAGIFRKSIWFSLPVPKI